MRAAVVNRYGPPEVVAVEELPLPEPGPRDVVVKVVATTVNSGDARIRGADFPPGFAALARLGLGIRRPRHRVLGTTFSGEISAVGHDVVGHQVGDHVAGMTGMSMGTHAEYVRVRAGKVVRKQAAVSHDDAAGVLFGGTTALHFLMTRAHLLPGQSLLVNGASGAVGSAAVQIARHHGARVTAVTGPRHLDLVRELGAEEVHDHTTTDVAGLAARFDVVLDCVGNLSPATGRPLLTPSGTLALVVATFGQTLTARGRVVAGPAEESPDHFVQLLDLVAKGRIRVVHDQSFSLEEIVEAHRLVDSGHKGGVVVVRP